MKTISFVLLCTGILIFTSCQKDISDELPQQAADTDTLLQAILIGDTVNPGKNLTLWEFIYDGNDRVTEIKNTYFDSANGTLTIHDQVSTYFYYTGSDKLPFKSFGWTRYISTEYEVFHFYDNAGRLVLDSLGAPDQSHMLNRFDYLAGEIKLNSSFYDETAALTDEYDETFAIAANNITGGTIFFPLTQAQENVFEFTYDNKVNPLSKLNIASTLAVEGLTVFDKFISLSPGYSRNNIVKRTGTSTYAPATNVVKEYEYTYNSNNLPISAKFSQNGNGDEGIRMFFTYTD